MRINKYIAAAGVCSRRKADELILAGKVKVNRVPMNELGYDVLDTDLVEVAGQVIAPAQKKVYLVLHKPVGYITTASDEQGRPTVLDLVTDVTERVFPVGRLDYQTSGMLLLTNDGDFSYQVAHPKHQMGKTYRAQVAGVFSEAKAGKLRRGVDIGGYVTRPAQVTIIRGSQAYTEVEITIHEGKNRQVRRMFQAVGTPVLALKRTAIGDLPLGRLAEGHWRKLTKEEVAYLLGK